MAIDWTQVGSDVQKAVVGVLGANWQTVKTGASAQITALLMVGQSIETDAAAGTITELEYKSLKASQETALSGILHSYEAIGIVVAQQAAAAAWNVVCAAISKAYALPFAL
jgi:hypothetical protein